MAERERGRGRGGGAGAMAMATQGRDCGKGPVGPCVLGALPSHRRLVDAKASCLRGLPVISAVGLINTGSNQERKTSAGPTPAVTVVALEWWKSITFSKSALRNHHLPSV
ncbi:hypothetical protein D623_10005787 [Myotis brandtii]|uniref:Uncharacterized protein n=1 Tax=Myotis brandtii TaxID=109478 RepID=S7NRQ2_MYOBR|nr:hypothetical protein D623_10005787 [Myotis brandtii]